MVYDVAVATIFKIINFVCITGGAYALFRKFLARQITDKIQEEEHAVVALHEKADTLRQEQKILDERIAYDKEYASMLEKNITLWLQYVQQDRKKAECYFEERKTFLLHKQAVQQENLQQETMRKIIVPRAVHRAQDQLQEEYKSQEKQDAFMDAVMAVLRRG